uniref:Tyrosine-protein kinase AmsA ) n=1 Tax=Ganoderma boninense TaxID=34458 RepID=A0A5K1K1J8_9APHY|nr:Putative tyrosine-protein kinase AmsA (EC (Amylovoran biosynthesis membrane-associated protein AmsA) [Ganoderma boninense]
MTAYISLTVLAVFGYLALKVFRNYLFSSPLDNIPGPPPVSLWTGHLPQLFDRKAWKFMAHTASTYGPISLLKGLFGRRILLIHDPLALHAIVVKEQEFYTKYVTPSNDVKLYLGPGVLTTVGEQHMRQRKLLNPVFSVSHLRKMTHIFYNVAHKMRSALALRLPRDGDGKVLDVNEWMARTTLEMLGQAGLGYSFDNFEEDSIDPYGESIKMSLVKFKFLVEQLSWVFSDASLLWLLSLIPSKDMRRMLKITDTMRKHSQRIIDEKKAALKKGNDALKRAVGEGKDIMIRANMAAGDKEKMTDEEILAQTSTFILAGMESTSNALSRVLHLLAQNPTMQEKLRAEIIDAQGGAEPGDTNAAIPYDDLNKLPYLDAVCRETLRMHAPLPITSRLAAKDMVLPLATPVRGNDGRVLHEIVVPEGTGVLVHYQGSNSAPELWGDDAHEWKPERWLAPLPQALEDARIPGVYSNLMTFSGGASSCIGFKFGQLEMKIVLATLLSSFAFELSDKDITWNWAGVMYPTMGEESNKSEMLLKVKAL